MNKNLLAAGLSILLLLFTSSTALAHYCDDGYYVERQSREDCWWRVAADNPTQLDLVLDTGPTDLTLASPGPSDMKLLRVGDNGTLRGYSAPSIAGFGQLTPSTFTWQGTTHTITNLAVNPIHGGPGAWTVFMEVSPALTHNAERLTLQAGDRWFNFADARMDGGYVFWYGAMPDWTDGDIVPVRVRAYPASSPCPGRLRQQSSPADPRHGQQPAPATRAGEQGLCHDLPSCCRRHSAQSPPHQ